MGAEKVSADRQSLSQAGLTYLAHSLQAWPEISPQITRDEAEEEKKKKKKKKRRRRRKRKRGEERERREAFADRRGREFSSK